MARGLKNGLSRTLKTVTAPFVSIPVGYEVSALLVHEPVGSDELVVYDDVVV